MTATHRLGLPHILPGQAQKELFHNEALQTLDALVAGAVEEGPRASPPSAPDVGACYIVAHSATGEWQGRDRQIAAYGAGGWRFIAPVEGMCFQLRASGETATYLSGEWELGVLRGSSFVVDGQRVVGAQAPAIANPSGGAQADAEARAAIGAILAALRGHGLIAQ